MKKFISLLVLATLILTAVGCSAVADNTDPVDPKEDEGISLILQVVEYDSETDTLAASENWELPEIGYYISMEENSNLDTFKAGDMIAVSADVIMESYPAQVVANHIRLATEEEISKEDPTAYKEAKLIDFEVVDFMNMSDDLAGHIDFSRPTAGHEFFTIDEGTFLAIYMGERNTGGFSIRVDRIFDFDDSYLVSVEEISPGKDSMVTMAFTYPVTVIKLPEGINTENMAIERYSNDQSQVNFGEDFYITPIDNFTDGDLIIRGEIVAFEGSTLHILSGCLVEVFEVDQEMTHNFYLGETVSLVKSGDTIKIESYIKEDFSINHTNMGDIILSLTGRVESVNGDDFTLLLNDETKKTFKGAEYLNIQEGEMITLEYIEFLEGDLYASDVLRESDLLELKIIEINRLKDGSMQILASQDNSDEVSYDITLNGSTTIRVNLSELKPGDSVKIYANEIMESFPMQVIAKRIEQ